MTVRLYYRSDVVGSNAQHLARILVWGKSDAPEYVYFTISAYPGAGSCSFRVTRTWLDGVSRQNQHNALLGGFIGMLRRIRVAVGGRAHVASLGFLADSIIDAVRLTSTQQARAYYGAEYESYPAWNRWATRRSANAMLADWPPPGRARS